MTARSIAVWTLFLLLSVSLPSVAAIHAVPGNVMARYFDESRSAWNRLAISLYYDDQGGITLMGGQGRGRASVQMSIVEFHRLYAALQRGALRLQHHAGNEDVLEMYHIIRGQGADRHGLAVSLWGGGDELEAAVVLFLQDDENTLNQIELYLAAKSLQSLITLFGQVPGQIPVLHAAAASN